MQRIESPGPAQEIPREAQKEVLPGSVVEVEVPEAKFRIVYGRHDIEQPAEDIGTADAIILETGSIPFVGKDQDGDDRAAVTVLALAYNLFSEKDSFPQYVHVLQKAEKDKTPIFFIDISGRMKRDDYLTMVLQLAETGAGVALLASLGIDVYDQLTQGKKMDRRRFLKMIGKGVAGVYLGTPSIYSAIQLFASAEGRIDEKSISRRAERDMGNINEKIHPELHRVVVQLRNVVMAQKMVTVAKRIKQEQKGSPHKPAVSCVFGAAHFGIEAKLKMPGQERIEIVNKLLNSPLLMLEPEARKNIASIARLDFNAQEDKWKLTELFQDSEIAQSMKENKN